MTDVNDVTEAIHAFEKHALGNVKVMMVEDDPIITDLVSRALSQHGCVPYSTLSSTEAMDLAERFQPDVIILDLMMPTISGEVLLAKLKLHPQLGHIPVIVYTNKGDDADRIHVRKLGASEYFVKASTDIPTLVEAVIRHGSAGK